MQLIKQEYVKDEGGALTLVAESGEDLWHVYNLITTGDLVKAATIRKVTRETSMGSQDSQRMRLTLSVEVLTVEYDPDGGVMRIQGKVHVILKPLLSLRLIVTLSRSFPGTLPEMSKTNSDFFHFVLESHREPSCQDGIISHPRARTKS